MSKLVKTNSNGKLQISIKKAQFKRDTYVDNKNFSNIKKNNFIRELQTDKWIKVVFPNGYDFDPEWIRQELEKASNSRIKDDKLFQIYNYRTIEKSAYVFIKLNHTTLQTFKTNCSSIPHPFNGNKYDVEISQVAEPETPVKLTEKWIECIKEALSKRYDAGSKRLDLSNFADDEYLNRCGIWASLKRPGIVSTITKLFESVGNIDINTLDLSDNKLIHLFHWSSFFYLVPVQHLNLSRNTLLYESFMKSLNCTKNLITLVIEQDNGHCHQKMKNLVSFIAELTTACPTLQKLNSHDVRYDVTRGNIRLPATVHVLSETDSLMLSFFKDHAEKIDTDRESLLDYYTSDSVMTLSAFYHDETSNNRRLGELYLRNNRSLDKLKNETKRLQLIKRGTAQILGFYSELSKMRHINESCTLDVIVNSDMCKIFVVNGLFVEYFKVTSKSSQYSVNNSVEAHFIFNTRLFSRAFIVVPPGKVIQENWTITNPTDALFRKYRNHFDLLRNSIQNGGKDGESSSRASSSVVVVARAGEGRGRSEVIAGTSSSAVGGRSVTMLSPEQKIVQEFSNFTGMNLMYSEQCLKETNWNTEQAKQVFENAYASGLVPREAFVKTQQ